MQAPAILASKKDAVKESNAYTDDNLGLLAKRVDEVNSAQNKETESLWAHMDQQRQEIDSVMRGNAIGATEYTDQQFKLFDMQLAEIVVTQAKINARQGAEIETLQSELDMVRSEHQQDIARLEALISGREFVPQEPVAVAAKSVEYPPIIPPDSVWK